MLEIIKKNDSVIVFAAWNDDLEGVKLIIEPNCFLEDLEDVEEKTAKIIMMSKIEFVENYGQYSPEVAFKIAQRPMQEAREAIEQEADTRTVYYHKQMLQRFEKALSCIGV